MSLATQIASAIELAQFFELPKLADTVWRAHAVGQLDDATAQRLAEAIEAKRPKWPTSEPTSFHPPKVPRQRCQQSPDKARSIARRRRLAAASPVPRQLIDQFTTCELAVLYIVVDEILKHGRCCLYIALIAARAGTSDTKVRDALHKARAVGLLYKHERRREGQKSKSNVVFILNKQWGAWLRNVWNQRRPARRPETEAPPGYGKTWSTEDKIQKERNVGAVDGSGEAYPTTNGAPGGAERDQMSRA